MLIESVNNIAPIINNFEILLAPILGTIYLMVFNPFVVKNAKEAISRVKKIDQNGAYLKVPLGHYNLPIEGANYTWILDVSATSPNDTTGNIRGIPPASSNIVGGTVVDTLGQSKLYLGNLEQKLDDQKGEAFVISEPVDLSDPTNNQKKVFGVVVYKP